MRKINWRLSALQAGSMLSTVILTVVLVALYHHLTEDFYIPLPEYLGSIKLVAPPLLVLISSYMLTFLLGEKFSDAPKLAIKYLRDIFLQSQKMMVCFILVVLVASVIFIYEMISTAPPYYESLVAKLLGGEQDRQELISKDIHSISEKNNGFSKELQLVVDVFSLRSKWNFSDAPANTTEPRILIRALDSNISTAWQQHPLRVHALAEAYSMWAQAAKSSDYSSEAEDWKNHLRKAIELYDKVIQSDSPLATPLMRVSALHNAGNAYYYAGDLTNALIYYNRALAENKNLSTAGNVVALLVLQKKYEEAFKFGDEYMEWGKTTGKALTEGSSYSAVVGNSAFAHLIMQDYDSGLKLMLEAYDLESDDMNTLDLATALILSGKLEMAASLLARHFRYPVLDVADQATQVSSKYNRCYYLVDSVMRRSSAPSVRAANFYMYLQEARTPKQLEAETSASVEKLLGKVKETVEKDAGACKDLLAIPKFEEMMHGI